MYFSVCIRNIFLSAVVLFANGLNAFAEENKVPDWVLEDGEQGNIDGEKLISDEELAALLSRSFSKDFKKYHFSTRMKVEHGCRVIIPVGIGVALVLVSGPGGVIPVVVGIGYGIKARLDHLKNKKMRSIFKGSLLYLQEIDKQQTSSRNRKRLEVYDEFFKDVRADLKTYIGREVDDQELKTYLAYQLLIINRYGSLIIERYKNIKKHKWWKGPLTDVYTQSFLKKNLVLLIKECSEYLLKTTDLNSLDKLAGR